MVILLIISKELQKLFIHGIEHVNGLSIGREVSNLEFNE